MRRFAAYDSIRQVAVIRTESEGSEQQTSEEEEEIDVGEDPVHLGVASSRMVGGGGRGPGSRQKEESCGERRGRENQPEWHISYHFHNITVIIFNIALNYFLYFRINKM